MRISPTVSDGPGFDMSGLVFRQFRSQAFRIYGKGRVTVLESGFRVSLRCRV